MSLKINNPKESMVYPWKNCEQSNDNWKEIDRMGMCNKTEKCISLKGFFQVSKLLLSDGLDHGLVSW